MILKWKDNTVTYQLGGINFSATIISEDNTNYTVKD